MKIKCSELSELKKAVGIVFLAVRKLTLSNLYNPPNKLSREIKSILGCSNS